MLRRNSITPKLNRQQPELVWPFIRIEQHLKLLIQNICAISVVVFNMHIFIYKYRTYECASLSVSNLVGAPPNKANSIFDHQTINTFICQSAKLQQERSITAAAAATSAAVITNISSSSSATKVNTLCRIRIQIDLITNSSTSWWHKNWFLTAYSTTLFLFYLSLVCVHKIDSIFVNRMLLSCCC